MTKVYELPNGHRLVADIDESTRVCHITETLLDSLISKLNYYADGQTDVLPSAEPTGDLISRQDAYKCLEIHGDYDTLNEVYERLEKLPPVKPQEPCEDAISRQVVLDILDRESHKWGNDCRDWEEAITEIKDLPSVKPQEPKTGHWIYDRTRDWDGECKYECSECGMGSDVDYAYCMRCGARMVEPQESEE